MNKQKEYLILIVDSDLLWCSTISEQLVRDGYRAAIAHSNHQAREMFRELMPHLALVALDDPDIDGYGLLIDFKNNRDAYPVLLTHNGTDSDSEHIITALEKGAFDSIGKQCCYRLLSRKIEHALRTTALTRENSRLAELSTFITITSKLTAAQDLNELVDLSFKYFMQITESQNGTLQLFGKNTSVQEVQNCTAEGFTSYQFLDTYYLKLLRQKVIETGSSLVLAQGKTTPETDLPIESWGNRTVMVVPLKVGSEIRGVVSLERIQESPSFAPEDVQAAEILAVQVSSSFANNRLFEAVEQKMHELQLISSYSEKLMGVVDKYDVIRSLFETICPHIEVDFLGFLVVQRRNHEFLYWARGTVEERQLHEFCRESIDVFNKTATASIRKRRITYTPFKLAIHDDFHGSLPPLAFRYIAPVSWEESRFGAIFLGAAVEPKNSAEKLTLFSNIIGQTRIALNNTKLYSDMKENYIRTIKALAIAVDAKDTYTHGHSENVMNIGEEIAREMSIDEKTVGSIRDAGLLHDIGKIGIPGYILNKPGPLTYEEFNGIMKTHSTLGANIVRDVPFLHDLHKLILYHHEHYDGTGYPEGIRGEQIPLGARILHVADAFEAMTSNRPYRNSLGHTEAIHRLIEESGKQFDPSIIVAFLRIARKKGWMDATVSDTPKNTDNN